MNWAGKKVLVLGDIMADIFQYGYSERLSPDAPVPVVNIESQTFQLGGASNVAFNVEQLGGVPKMVGVVGDDYYGHEIIRYFSSCTIVMTKRKTTLKKRLFSNGQQIVRIDEEETEYINGKTEKEIKTVLEETVPFCDAVIVSDYGKGVITRPVMDCLSKILKIVSIPFIIDPFPFNLHCYRCKPDLFVPNVKELRDLANIRDYKSAVLSLFCSTMTKALLVTKGHEGMQLFIKRDERTTKFIDDSIYIPALNVKPKFLAGAGDVVSAVLGLSLAADYSLEEAANFANYAAAIAIGKRETCFCGIEELKEKWKK